uniref:Uncharacterized protein n=1 Tax=Leersia perrieri TaxID=77586 RepID=A0A0D9W748_9ORYZ
MILRSSCRQNGLKTLSVTSYKQNHRLKIEGRLGTGKLGYLVSRSGGPEEESRREQAAVDGRDAREMEEPVHGEEHHETRRRLSRHFQALLDAVLPLLGQARLAFLAFTLVLPHYLSTRTCTCRESSRGSVAKWLSMRCVAKWMLPRAWTETGATRMPREADRDTQVSISAK